MDLTMASPGCIDPLVSTLAMHVSCNPAVRKLVDSAGKITILGSGKATTRAEGRITAALRVLGLCTAIPTRAFRKT